MTRGWVGGTWVGLVIKFALVLVCACFYYYRKKLNSTEAFVVPASIPTTFCCRRAFSSCIDVIGAREECNWAMERDVTVVTSVTV